MVRLDLVCFFFQAEDGIRDIGVTGVQTCALPISPCSPCSLVRLTDPLSRPDLAASRSRRAAAVMEGAQPPAATRSRASMARLASTAPSPPRAPWQPHPPSERLTHHASDRRPRYELSAATALTRTVAREEVLPVVEQQ